MHRPQKELGSFIQRYFLKFPTLNSDKKCRTQIVNHLLATTNYLVKNLFLIFLFFSSLKGKDGSVYKKHGGFCLETQKFPNSVNQPNFPNSVVRPGDVYKHTVVYKLGKN